jgi:hypothetical protein
LTSFDNLAVSSFSSVALTGESADLRRLAAVTDGSSKCFLDTATFQIS